MSYSEFLQSKVITHVPSGKDVGVSDALFDFQRDITRWAARKGRSAIFADCGLGKTPMQLQWADALQVKTLILAPLAVAPQTVREGTKFDVEVCYQRKPERDAAITITNYEMLEHFDADKYEAIVLDESSIIKHFEGKLRNLIIERFRDTPYKLACTATPAPNDFMELGNHSEFLGNLTRTEMLSTFFVHDGGDTAKWRLKGHAEAEFWKWVCSWAVMLRKPSDLGYDDALFRLPELRLHELQVEAETCSEGMLFPMPAVTLQERQRARASSTEERADAVAAIVSTRPMEQWLVWCNLNNESRAATERIAGAVEVCGSDSPDFKERSMADFAAGKIQVLVSKPSICGFGLNFQSCHNVVFLGLSDSYEQFYQAIRRCWRFGQKSEVDCYIVTSTAEGEVVKNIKRKEADAQRMAEEMVNNMHELNQAEIKGNVREKVTYQHQINTGEAWTMHLGDCVEVLSKFPANSIHYSIYSPPFASLYTYSASERDMGNSRTHAEFFTHLEFLAPELLRVLLPGRLMSFHCMDLPTSKERDGVIGLSDFRGKLIALFERAGFILHSQVTIWKDPVTAMQRTKALGLLHKQLKKDSCMSRQGIPDYLVTMRKPGENPQRVTHYGSYEELAKQSVGKTIGPHDLERVFPVQVWQRYASPVWMDINPSDTLQRESAREEKDERHICPLQLEVIARALRLWTNPFDTVLSPFAGIGSEGYEAVKSGRNFIGIELKRSYWEQACGNLKAAAQQNKTLFDIAAAE
jgi:superfamily II DNA or RNA helicase